MTMSLTFPGVYLTDLSQDKDKITVAKNCWGEGYRSAIKDGKLGYAICIVIPSKELRRIEKGKRVIYVYSGQLHLHNYRHVFIECSWGNNSNGMDNNGIILLRLLGGLVSGLVGTIAIIGIARLKAHLSAII